MCILPQRNNLPEQLQRAQLFSEAESAPARAPLMIAKRYEANMQKRGEISVENKTEPVSYAMRCYGEADLPNRVKAETMKSGDIFPYNYLTRQDQPFEDNPGQSFGPGEYI